MSKIDVYWVEMWGQFKRMNINIQEHIKYISYRISSLCIELGFPSCLEHNACISVFTTKTLLRDK
jgi:hypothetical protein